MATEGFDFDLFVPAGTPKASVEIVHGMAEHRQRYTAFAKYLASRGYAVAIFDLPGHGTSCKKEDLGWFGEKDGWKTMEDKVLDIMKIVKERWPDVPFVLMGHSMGTILTRDVLQDHSSEFDAVILSGAPNCNPAAKSGITLAKVVRTFKGARGHSKILDQMVTGNFNKKIKNAHTPVDWLSYNTENVDRYIAEPLDGFPFTIQGYIDEMEGIVKMSNGTYHVTRADLPIYFFAGEEDPCTGGSEGFADSIMRLHQAGYTAIDAKRYPHMRHETLNEINREDVWADVGNWLDSHASRQ